MTAIELLEKFEVEINIIDDVVNKPKTADSEYFINSAISQYVSTRITGNNSRRRSFGQDDKRLSDLRNLVETVEKTVSTTDDPKKYQYTFSSIDPLLLLGVRPTIMPNTDRADIESIVSLWPKNQDGTYAAQQCDVIEVSETSLRRLYNIGLSEHNLRYSKAKPLYLETGDNMFFYTDGKYIVNKIEISYLRKPSEFVVSSSTDELSDFSDTQWYEIIRMAAKKYVDSVNPSVGSKDNMVNTME
jgi:hypothetical protein